MTIERILGGKVVVGSVIAAGVSSVVHEGTDYSTKERVAVKITRSFIHAEGAMRMRTEHALRIRAAGPGWLVMDRLEGRLLAERIAREGPLPIALAARLALQVCEAVAEAHALGMVHGDLGPRRVFITTRPDGTPSVRVLGFTRPSAGGDSRIDIFGIGTILLSMGGAMIATSPPFEATVRRCLAQNPDERFQTIEELAEALVRFAPPDAATYLTRIRRVAQPTGGVMVMSDPPPSLDDRVLKPRRFVRYLAITVASAAIALYAFQQSAPAPKPNLAAELAPPPPPAMSVPPPAPPSASAVPTMPRPSPPKVRSAKRPHA